MKASEQVAQLEKENAELKAKITALEAQLAGKPVYIPYPVYPQQPCRNYYSEYPWFWGTWCSTETTAKTAL